MPIYNVIRKSDGEEVMRYCAEQITEQVNENLFAQADYDHVEYIEGGAVSTAPTGPRRLTKLGFVAKLGNDAFGFVLTAAKASVEMETFLKMVELATPDADGTSIDLDDERTIYGVTQLGAALEAQGIVQPGWAQEILNG